MTIQTLPLRSSVRRTIARSVLFTIALCFSHALFAQQLTRTVAAVDIPFSFTAEKKVLPAGHYTFVQYSQHLYALKQADGTTVQYMTVLDGDRPTNGSASTVRFHRYGDSNFLEGAYFASSGLEFHLREGKAEKQIEASSKLPKDSGVILALNTAASQK
jgi:hypothetical protein